MRLLLLLLGRVLLLLLLLVGGPILESLVREVEVLLLDASPGGGVKEDVGSSFVGGRLLGSFRSRIFGEPVTHLFVPPPVTSVAVGIERREGRSAKRETKTSIRNEQLEGARLRSNERRGD